MKLNKLWGSDRTEEKDNTDKVKKGKEKRKQIGKIKKGRKLTRRKQRMKRIGEQEGQEKIGTKRRQEEK